ncbi:unnamed protein product, partial [Ectocarpus sp. 4 AP-2014]
EAAACDAILRGQVAQLRRQVRLQWCAVDASSAVTQEVKAVLGHLEDTLLELTSLGQDGSSSSGPRFPGGFSSRQRSGTPKGTAGGGGGGGGTGAGFHPGVTAGGVFGDAALPAWRQVLDRVKDLSRRLRWAERAAQKAADGRIHVGQSTGTFLSSPHPARGGGSGQRRPRDIRLRALDPDHFTCPPPAHGELHHR